MQATHNTEDDYDILVLGSGLVGSSFLLAHRHEASLCNRHPSASSTHSTLKIAVIDKTDPKACSHPHQEARAIALSHRSVEILKKLKVWPTLQSACTDIKAVHVSAQGKFGSTRFSASDIALASLGAVVDAEVLNAALNTCTAQLPGLSIFRPDEILDIAACPVNASARGETIDNSDRIDTRPLRPKKSAGWKIALRSGETITARLLVGADGTESLVRKRFGVEALRSDYQQYAVVSNVYLEEDHHYVAYERFLSGEEYGSIALLPFGEKQVKCILIIHQNALQALLSLSEQDYLVRLQACFGYRVGRFKALGKRSSYPLLAMSAETLYAPGWVLLGNAANTLHPIAAQGFNLGLRDATLLAEVLCDAWQKNPWQLASAALLRSYAEKRKMDHFRTKQFTEALATRKSLWQLGILCSEFIPAVKNRIMLQGLGNV